MADALGDSKRDGLLTITYRAADLAWLSSKEYPSAKQKHHSPQKPNGPSPSFQTILTIDSDPDSSAYSLIRLNSTSPMARCCESP